MNHTRAFKISFGTIAWALLFLWWGFRWLFDFLPNGTGLVGTGLILLGLNAARSLSGGPARSLTTTLGIVALVSGGLLFADSVLRLPFDVPIVSTLLIALGGVVLAREVIKARRTDAEV